MESSYDSGFVETEEGITFKKVGYFFKKAWLRMIVYTAVLALLVTAIAVPIKVFLKSEPIAQTSVEFIYKGIERGLAPDGSALDTDNIISTTVLANAVKEAKLEKKIKDVSSLRDAMRVEGVATDEYVKLIEAAQNGDKTAADRLLNYNMHPTRFDIIISDPSGELDLSDDQAKLLLNKVVKCYYDDFQERFSVSKMFVENSYVLSQNESLEFTNIYDIYLQSLDSIKTFLQEMSVSAGGFVSNKNSTTFAQLLSDANVLGSSYNQFNAYILSNNIWRDAAAAKSELETNKIDINNRLGPLNEYITALTDQIAKFQPNTTTSDNGGTHSVTVSYPNEYFVYQARLDDSNRQVRDYNVQLKNIETRLEKLAEGGATDSALTAAAVKNLAEIEAASVAFIQKVNSTIADYYDTTFVSQSVRQVQPPVVTRRSTSFNLLIVYLIAVIAGVLAASFVTIGKIYKSKSAMEKSAATAETENTKDQVKSE